MLLKEQLIDIGVLRGYIGEKASDILIKNLPFYRSFTYIRFLYPSKIIEVLLEHLNQPNKLSDLLCRIANSDLNLMKSRLTISDAIAALPIESIPSDILNHCSDKETTENIVSALPANFIHTIFPSYTIETLKIILKRKGLKLSGKKAELVKRIADSQSDTI